MRNLNCKCVAQFSNSLTFIFAPYSHSDIDDINTDQLHLDCWDHDDDTCVLDSVSRLNEVRGVRGLGRFFKQVCQSARQGSQDDFLGSINIPISVRKKLNV